MELIQTRALRGPNLWSRNTALEIEVSCSQEECALNTVSGFMETLRGLCPSIGSLEAPGHQGPLTLAHALEATLLALQAQAGCPVSFSCTSATPVTGVYQVVVEYSEEDVGRRALKMALQLKALLDATVTHLQNESDLPEQIAFKPTDNVDNPFK